MNAAFHRRALHRIPELERNLPKTMEYLESVLRQYRCDVFAPMEHALAAWFDFGAEKAIAFRADADALPITETTGAEYASTHPGQMHACGHDGHMAILLELARRLSKTGSLDKNILLVFQPAEETIGGAYDICRTGVFEKYHVEAIFGLHLWPGLEKGVIHSRRGELMARSSELTVDIYGRSAHIGRSWEGLDTMAAAVEFYSRVTQMERDLPDQIFRLLKFGKMTSGSVRNAISDHTHIEGSLRAFQDEIYDHLKNNVIAIASDIEEKTGCRFTVHLSQGYPAILNPAELCDRVMGAVPFRELETPSMTSEDFSWYQRFLPGMFFFLGTGDTPALHSSNFDFDETVLDKGADFFEKLAQSF